MLESQLVKKIEKISSHLEKTGIIRDCCEVAKKYGNPTKKNSIVEYNFLYGSLLINYAEDREINGIESGKKILVHLKTLGTVLYGERDEIKDNVPISDDFHILTYLPRKIFSNWEREIRKIKKEGEQRITRVYTYFHQKWVDPKRLKELKKNFRL